jgi:hypothetical protein
LGINPCGFFVELPGLDSNQDKESQNLLLPDRNANRDGTLPVSPARRLPRLDQTDEKPAAVDPDLARVLEAWPRLSEPARRMILAAVDAAAGERG